MFILRTVWPKGHQSNNVIGERYDYVERNTPEFEYYCKGVFAGHSNAVEDEKHCKGFIICGTVFPIYDTADFYVMTESGKTFARL